jgi:uncharacterized membrane-anchored protein
VIKVLTTALGETTSDYLVHQIEPVIAVAIGGIGLAVAMTLQLLARRYTAWIYWLAVSMVAVFGTMVADVLHIGLGIPYLVSTIGFGLALVAVFLAWSTSERTLSIQASRPRAGSSSTGSLRRLERRPFWPTRWSPLSRRHLRRWASLVSKTL